MAVKHSDRFYYEERHMLRSHSVLMLHQDSIDSMQPLNVEYCTWVIFFPPQIRDIWWLLTWADPAHFASEGCNHDDPSAPLIDELQMTPPPHPREMLSLNLDFCDKLIFYSFTAEGLYPAQVTVLWLSPVKWPGPLSSLDNHYMCSGAKTLWEGSPMWFFIFIKYHVDIMELLRCITFRHSYSHCCLTGATVWK